MARGRRRRSRQRDDVALQNALGWVLLLAVLALGGAVYWWYETKRSAHAGLDKETLCPGTGPVAVSALLIDRTDPLTPVQRASVSQALESVKRAVQTGGLLELYSVGPTDESVRAPLAALCNPGRGLDVSGLDANPRFLEQRWHTGFDEPLQQIFSELVQDETAPRSPIMESIQSVSVTAFGPSERKDVPRKLVLISDMLQHTDGASHYRALVPFDALKDDPYYRKVSADLRDVEVEIFYVRRETKQGVQGGSHIQFWRDYIADQGGIVVHVDRIEG